MSDKPLPRPPQATFCGGTIIAGSVLVVLLAFSRMASLGTIEAQEEAQLFADSVGNGVGLTADDWQGVLRVLCVIAGGLGVITAYLGWRVLQRDRSARVALSVLAPIALVAGIAVADFIPAILAVAVVLLWRSPTRDWFDGKVAPKPEPRPARRPDPVAAAVQPQATGSDAPSSAAAPVWPGAAAYPPPPDATVRPSSRPATVLTAAIMTIATSTIVLLALVAAVFLVADDRASFESDVADEMGSQQAYQDLDVDPAVIVDVFIGLIVVFAVWALVAIVLAVMTLRGSNGARITLVVSAIVAALASLLGVLVVVPLLVTAVCVAVAVLLLRRDAAAWFTKRPETDASGPR